MADETPFTMVGETKVPLRPPTPEPIGSLLSRILNPIMEQLRDNKAQMDRIEAALKSKDKAK